MNNNNGNKDHIHIYEAISGKSGNYTRFRCTLPDCYTIHDRALLSGKRARCPFGDCGREFIITKAMMRMKKIHPKGCNKKECSLKRIEDILGLI